MHCYASNFCGDNYERYCYDLGRNGVVSGTHDGLNKLALPHALPHDLRHLFFSIRRYLKSNGFGLSIQRDTMELGYSPWRWLTILYRNLFNCSIEGQSSSSTKSTMALLFIVNLI